MGVTKLSSSSGQLAAAIASTLGGGALFWWVINGRCTVANNVKHRPFSTMPTIVHHDAGNPKGRSLQLRVLILGDACAGAENQSKGLVEHMVSLAQERNIKIQCTFRRILPTSTFRVLPASMHIALAGLLWPFTKTLGLRVLDTDQSRVQMNITPGKSFGAQQVGSSQHDSSSACRHKNAIESHDQFLSPCERDILLGDEGGFPDVVVACGRTTAPASVAIRRASNQRTYNIQIQDPRCGYTNFDAVITPAHDDKSIASILRSLVVKQGHDNHGSLHSSQSENRGSMHASMNLAQDSCSSHKAGEQSQHSHESSSGGPHGPDTNTLASHTENQHEHRATHDNVYTESIRTRLWQWQCRRILTVGSLHGVTKSTLAVARAQAAHVVQKDITEASLIFGVLVGGPTRHCAWSMDDLMHDIDTFISAWATRRLKDPDSSLKDSETDSDTFISTSATRRLMDSDSSKYVPERPSVGVVILLSRRTPKHVIARLSEWAAHTEKSRHNTRVQIFGHTDFPGGINPYKAVLDMSTCVIVTADSVSMCTEAVAAERHVCVACVHKATGKLALMHRLMALVCGTHSRVGLAELSLHDLESACNPRDTEKVTHMLMDRIEHRLK
jgi:mitochondrial fission protein ELM1